MRVSTLFYTLPYVSIALAQISQNTTYLTALALVTNPRTNTTVIECWKLLVPFKRSSAPGVSGTQVATLFNATDLAYTILPPRYDGGLHNAPVPQLVHFTSGMAHVTVPQNESLDLWIVGGKGGLLFAVDTEGIGHVTRYPSDQETVAIVAPSAEGRIPEHEVMAHGPCFGKQTFV